MTNLFKVHLTPVQREAVDAGRERLLTTLRAPPFSRGQRAGEFAVHFVQEWVDADGTLDQFIIEHADAPLDGSWHTSLPDGSDLMHEGRGAYRLWVRHDAYLAVAQRQRWGLPFRVRGECACKTAWDVAVAAALIAASVYLMPSSGET